MKKGAYGALILIVLLAVIVLVVVAGRIFRRPAREVLIKVGDEAVTTENFQEEWRKQFAAPGGIPPAGVEELLGDLVREKLFLAEAKRQRLNRDPRFLQEIENYQEQLLVQMLLNKEVLAISPPSPAEIEDYWKDRSRDFAVPDLVRVSLILITTRPDEDEAAALKRSREALDRIQRGEDFVQVAQAVTGGDNSGRGVDLGYFRPGWLNQWSPEIETAVWGLDVGKTAGPIKTARGYYIVKLTDRKPPHDKTLAEARDEVAAAIQAQKRKEKFEALEARLKNRTFIARNEQALSALKNHAGATP